MKKSTEGSQQRRAVSPDDSGEKKRSSSPAPRPSHHSRPSWTRSRSAGVSLGDEKRTSSQDNSSVQTGASGITKSVHSEPANIGIVPLKPPPRPERPRLPSTHRITIEKPFEAPDQTVNATTNDSSTSVAKESRRSSIDTRKLFSAPIQALRKVVQIRTSRSSSLPSSSIQPGTHSPSSHGKSHKSLLRMDHTGVTLERAASLLEGHQPRKLFGRIGTTTRLKSISTTSSSEPNDSRQDTAKTVSPTFNLFGKGSKWTSATSSILNMQMGSTPQNSPTELATYRVKRSPSAETEEFAKIDISIRGGTSYLPSEARRVHTPPLPRDDDKCTRRGHFFDYNAPNLVESHNTASIQSPHASKAATSKTIKAKPSVEQEIRITLASTLPPPIKVATRVPTSRLARSSSNRIPATVSPHPEDFYDAKLADVDAASSDIDVTTAKHQQMKHEQHKNKCQAPLLEIKRQQYEAQLDYNIPEHLPSSPLCPRNPKYWRMVKNKGSQFRGCWMHGYGEYDVVPGLRAGG